MFNNLYSVTQLSWGYYLLLLIYSLFLIFVATAVPNCPTLPL